MLSTYLVPEGEGDKCTLKRHAYLQHDHPKSDSAFRREYLHDKVCILRSDHSVGESSTSVQLESDLLPGVKALEGASPR